MWHQRTIALLVILITTTIHQRSMVARFPQLRPLADIRRPPCRAVCEASGGLSSGMNPSLGESERFQAPIIERIAPRLLPSHGWLGNEETRLCANCSACFLHRQWSQRFFVAARKRGIIAAMDNTAMCGVAATPITVRTRAAAPGTMSAYMSTSASPTVLPKDEPQQHRFYSHRGRAPSAMHLYEITATFCGSHSPSGGGGGCWHLKDWRSDKQRW